MKFATKAIHEGQEADQQTGAMIPPIYMTSTYQQAAPGETKGYDYTRAGNPNFTNFEKALASIEAGNFATIFSSGLGAATAMMSTLSSGDHVIAVNDLYGGSYRLFTTVFQNYGIQYDFLPLIDETELKHAITEKTKLIWIESPTNPLLKIVDIQKIAKIAHEKGIRVLVDNTFATSYFQNPLKLGADIVLHSTTKYIGGHSDIVGGALICNDRELKELLDLKRMSIGLNPSPFDVWLAHRGLKTLAVRMKQHQENALLIVDFLKDHPMVEKIYYPALETHENHAVAAKQMSGFSGIISVVFKKSLDEMKDMISSYKLFSLAESLGGIESLVDHPASMTHASIPKSEREKIGLSDGLVRFSVGIEDGNDLIDDIKSVL